MNSGSSSNHLIKRNWNRTEETKKQEKSYSERKKQGQERLAAIKANKKDAKTELVTISVSLNTGLITTVFSIGAITAGVLFAGLTFLIK